MVTPSAQDRLPFRSQNRTPPYFFDLDAIRQPLVTAKHQTTRDANRTYPPPGAGALNRRGWALNDNRDHPSRGIQPGRAPARQDPGDVWMLPTVGFRGGTSLPCRSWH